MNIPHRPHREPGEASTVQTALQGPAVFSTWAVAEGELAASPMVNIKPPKLDEPEVLVLTDGQLSAIVKACEGTDFDNRRDLAIVRLFIDTGVRLSELVNLTLGDVDLFDHHVAHVMGKGSKGRAVPFGAKTSQALDRYLKVRDRHRLAYSDRRGSGPWTPPMPGCA
jgi:site-specific recombinase XerC